MSEPVFDGIAVVGMAGRFPGARDLVAFWRNLRDGVESISFFSREEMEAGGVDPLRAAHPSYVPARGVLEGIDLFDADLFGFNPRDAEILDPQHRLFLECAWEALEAAGHDPDVFQGLIGVFAGSSMNTYLANNLRTHPALMADLGWQALFANEKDFVAPMAAYKLNLRGPAINVQTACSTSLVAISMAGQALLDYQCDMALAGGVSVFVPHKAGHLFQEGGIVSRDGHCRAFDAAADGSVVGSGVGVVVLKRLADALADGNTIRAVIKGMAINNDGSSKAGFTAPSQRGQAEVIAMAHAMAGVSGEDVQYVEAHGTGTRLGDPVEVAALARAFRTRERGVCALGAVKANIGHLDAAAGVAGFIKTVLALEHGQIPPVLHFREPNPELRLPETSFYVPAELREWPRSERPRRAGVSAFGIGGTNAHVVVEEAPVQPSSDVSRPWQLLALSARGGEALEMATDALARHLREAPDPSLADVAFTLQQGRRRLPHRRTLVCRDREDAWRALESRDPRRLASAVQDARERPVTFLLSGLGDHYPGMGLGLYRGERTFREAVDHCAEVLTPLLGADLRSVLFPSGTDAEEPVDRDGSSGLRAMLGGGAVRRAGGAWTLDRTLYAQPAVFVVDYALARVWMEWGIRPESLVGYSLGEYVAACLAGTLCLDDALHLVAERARLIDELPSGAMLAVSLSEEEARLSLPDGLSLAAANGPHLSVVAGPDAAVASLALRLAERGVICRRLPTTHAFHSRQMEPVADRFVELVASLELREPCIPWLSNVTGTWITAAEARDPGYWRRHLLQTVRFGEAVRELWREPARVLLEVGPGQGLSSLALQDPARPGDAVVVRSLRCLHEQQPDTAFLLGNLASLWLAGAAVDWAGFSRDERRRRVELPSYPFQRRRFWIEPKSRQAQAVPTTSASVVERAPDPADWFYLPGWRSTPWASGAPQGGPLLLFLDRSGLGAALADRLRGAGEAVATVAPGAAFVREARGSYRLPPGERPRYDDLVQALRADDLVPRAVVHLWSLDRPLQATREDAFQQAQEAGFISLLAFAQASVRLGLSTLRLYAVTAGAHEVIPGEELRPEGATVLGPCKVVPQEYPGATWRAVDLAVAETTWPSGPAVDGLPLIDLLLCEVVHSSPDPVVALRNGRRWVQEFHPLRIEALEPGSADPFRRDGVYLITGGLGNIGLTLTERLAPQGATVILTGREGLPAGRGAAERAARLRAVEEAGGRVEVHAADVSDAGRMQGLIEDILARHGALHGVFHAAGLVDASSFPAIRETQRTDWERHFAPKVRGLFALEQALAGTAPDFCFLFSSSSCVFGGLGFSAYSSANLFMDAFVRDVNRRSPCRWISGDWDTWEIPQDVGDRARSATRLSMSPDEAFDALRRVLSLRGVEQVVVSLGDLQRRLDLWVRPARSGGEGSARTSAPPSARHPRPSSLGTDYVAGRNDIESGLVTLWQDLLSIQPIGVYDNFFQLGGHSLLGVQLVSRVRDTFGVDLSVRSLFDDPTVAGMGAAVAEARADLVEEGAPAGARIPRRTGEGPWPLSLAQQRLWFVHQMDEAGSAYNSPVAFAASGHLDAAALEHALNEVHVRHESLRTVFPQPAGTPCQIVLQPVRLRLPRVDLSGLAEPLREPLARAIAVEEAERPFDLAVGPLFRSALLCLAPDRHVLLLNLHHVIFDGWSLGVLLRELGELYDAFRDGRAPSLPPLPIQAADFAVWQRGWLNGDVLERLVRFWTQHLRGAPPLLALPLDRPRPALQTWNGGRVTHRLSAALLAGVRELALAEAVSPFMVYLAALEALLYRWSGQSDLVVGVDSAGRNRAESEGLITFLVNVLPLRLQVDGRATFRALLRHVRGAALAAYAHEDLPFDKVVEAVRPERSASYSPLTQVLFAYQSAPLSLQLSGVRLEPLQVGHRRVKTDLVVSLLEIDAGAAVAWAYNTDLFFEETIARLAAVYEELLTAVLADPAVRIDEVPIDLAPRRTRPMTETSEPRDLRSRRQRGGGRRALDLSEVTLVRTSSLRDGETLPLVVEPGTPDVDLAEWAAGHRDWIDAELLEHGAILFHGFRLHDVAEFERFASSLCPELFGEYGDLPPETGSTRIYRSTPYPAEETILFHNESSHLGRWPMKQLFFCLQAAERGGETPIVDCRRVARCLPPEVLAPFATKGLRYVRHFTDGLDVSWQDFLRTTDRAVAEERCREASLEFEWTEDGGLRLSHTGPAVTAHPKTGETVFFNQVQLHHVSCLPAAVRASLLASFSLQDLPRHVLYGDGSPIPDGVMEEVGRAYWANAVTFPWTAGDVLLLDNMLVAHARNPYVGARRIAVAMGEMFEQANLGS